MKQILYFSGKFCAPCSSFKPTIDKISQQLNVVYIDVDENNLVVAEYGVRSVPTFPTALSDLVSGDMIISPMLGVHRFSFHICIS